MQNIDMKLLEQQFDQLTLDEKLLLIERLVRRVRHHAFIEPEEFERQMMEMANDTEFLKAAGMDNPPAPRANNAAG